MKVTFSGVGITEMTGKAQRIIIQKSYGGFQCRLLTIPNRRRTNATQNIRNNFAFVNSSWRSLTNEQRQTWIDAAPEGVSGFQFYSSFNLGLVNAGEEMLESFVAPVANPVTSIANAYSFSYANDGTTIEQGLIKNSGNNAMPVGDWVPSFVWTGWIPASRYQYPRINRALELYMEFYLTGSYQIYWTNYGFENQVAQGEGWKMKYQERWKNSVTGQLFVGETIEVVFGSSGVIGSSFTPGHSLASRVLTGSPGDYTLVTTWDSIGTPFDPDVWEPYFWSTDWLSSIPDPIPPTTNQVPNTAIEFTMGGQMIITFGDGVGEAPAPPNEGDFIFINFNWKNVLTGEISNDSAGGFEAENG